MAAFSGGSGLSAATCEIVIAVNPMLQDTAGVNFEDALELMDALETALKTSDIGVDRWEMQVEQDVIGSTPYWILTATVEASF